MHQQLSPYQLFLNHKPRYDGFRIFGAGGFMKLAKRSSPDRCFPIIFLAFSVESSRYQVHLVAILQKYHVLEKRLVVRLEFSLI